MTKVHSRNVRPETSGLILRGATARYYDLTVWVMTLGREQKFREKVIDLAKLRPGEYVLDVGCGTGTLAVAAKRRVGPAGQLYGIDASPEMIERARGKARKLGVEVVFKNEVIESLPFADAHFDAVLCTLMLHHLPRKLREAGAREVRRVLKPGGRVLAADFGVSERKKKGLFAHLYHGHGHIKLPELIAVFGAAGLNVVESGELGMMNLHYALAIAS